MTGGSDMVEARGVLEEKARELGRLGDLLAVLERELEPVQRQYDDFMEAHEIGLFERYEHDDKRLPAERLRDRLARRDMPAELLGRYEGMRMKRDRLTKRIGTLGKEVEAWRSIVSAAKEEAQGAGAAQYGRRAA